VAAMSNTKQILLRNRIVQIFLFFGHSQGQNASYRAFVTRSLMATGKSGNGFALQTLYPRHGAPEFVCGQKFAGVHLG
jgi:hypothetical protein